MRMQQLSYELNTSKIDFGDFKASLEIFSLENVYFPLRGTYAEKEGTYHSSSVAWGDEDLVPGEANLTHVLRRNRHVLTAKASLDRLVRSIKIRFDDLPIGTLLTTIDHDKPITENGLLLTYPEGWRGLQTPLLVFDVGGKYLVIRSLSGPVKTHHFFIRAHEGKMWVDVVYEEDATELTNSICSPEIEVYYADSLEEVYEEQRQYVESTYGLVHYENRGDVPSWFKQISLVVTLHMEAYTGKIFHTYEQAKNEILELTKYIEGKRILVYLPGWEGRYYFKYGNYTPDDRLGGPKALKDMVDALHQKGVHVMAMYGMNMVNSNLPGYEIWGEPAEFFTCGGGHFHSGSVDWEGGRHYDSSFLRQTNVAVKCFQDYLFEQIKSATLAYGFDAAFLDIAACHVNDRNAKLYDGVVEFCDRLRTIQKDFLVAGEGYYDGLAKAMPLFQSGHTDGDMHYHDRFYAPLFGDYSREFSHLCLGDFSRLSSGTHELGISPETRAPYRKSIIPTLCLVDGTLEKCLPEVRKTIEDAKRYAKEFIDGD